MNQPTHTDESLNSYASFDQLIRIISQKLLMKKETHAYHFEYPHRALYLFIP